MGRIKGKWCFMSRIVVRSAEEIVSSRRREVSGAEVRPDVVGIVS